MLHGGRARAADDPHKVIEALADLPDGLHQQAAGADVIARTPSQTRPAAQQPLRGQRAADAYATGAP
jgi:hypothetical protein